MTHTRKTKREKRFPVGKRIGSTVWVHRDYVGMLIPEDRAYVREGEGALLRKHRGYEWTIVKFDTNYRGLSFLSYPFFDIDPHPEIKSYVNVSDKSPGILEASEIKEGGGKILHRKELMVGEDHPRHEAWAQLTMDEEDAGLLGRDVASRVGYKSYWVNLLNERGFVIVRGILMERADIE